MKKHIKSFVGILLVGMMLFLLAGCAAQEQIQTPVVPLSFTLSADGNSYEAVAARENNLTTQALTVPATYEGKPVTIAHRAFYGLPELVSVTVEGAVGEISNQAFMNCPKLESVVLQGEATVAGKCFSSCSALKSIVFGDGISAIAMECVSDCPALETVFVGDDCKEIGAKAFQNCNNLKTLTLGCGLEFIGAYAFANTWNLTEVQFPSQRPLALNDYAFSYSGLEEIRLPANITLGDFVFEHQAWDNAAGYSRCKAVYFYSTEPTVDTLGMNAIGYTWDRTEENDPELGAFMVYVPEEAEDAYIDLITDECDESWTRCVLNMDRLATFVP